MRQKRNFCKGVAAGQFSQAIAKIALAHAGHRRVNRHHQGGKTCLLRPDQHGFGGFTAADKIKLIPQRARRRGHDILQQMSRCGRKNICSTGCASGPGNANFTFVMHDAGASHWRQENGKRNLRSQHRGSQVALGHGDSVTGSERVSIECRAVGRQGRLVLGGAIKKFVNHSG